MALSREFGLSRRQAYRYLELARTGRPAPPVAENSITITLKMPESLAGDLRAHASKHDLTTSEVIRRAVSAFLAAKRRPQATNCCRGPENDGSRPVRLEAGFLERDRS